MDAPYSGIIVFFQENYAICNMGEIRKPLGKKHGSIVVFMENLCKRQKNSML
jgi:hypothetical protein